MNCVPFDCPPGWSEFFELVASLGGAVGSIDAKLVVSHAPDGLRMACAVFDDGDAMLTFVEQFQETINARRDLHRLADHIGAGFGTCLRGRHFIYWPRAISSDVAVH
jgi:hypothetical protein